MNQLKRIVIVGRDADGWLTALMLQKSFSAHKSTIEVEFIELPSEATKVDFFSVLPSHKLLHEMLSAKEQTLLRLSGGMYSFGQRYKSWAGNNSNFLQSYDRFGVDFNQIPFYQYWQKAVNSGLKVPFESFNLGSSAAMAGRYVVFEHAENTFSNAAYGYQFEARAYTATIAKAAMSLGLIHHPVPISKITQGEMGIESIQLANGKEIKADLFIDASGSESILIKCLDSKCPESWNQFFPADRLIVAQAPKLLPLPAFNQITAFNAGWVGIYPLLNKTAVNIAYSSKDVEQSDALERAIVISGLKLEGATETQLEPNNRHNHWIKNCIAVGSAATNIEPLDATQLHILHLGLSVLRETFPQSNSFEPEAEIYNNRMRSNVQNIRDFVFARYHLNKRYGEAFWDTVREEEPPESLRYRIELFKSRGVIALLENDTFLEEDWLALFVSNLLHTENLDPLIEKISDEDLMSKFQQLLTYIKSEVERMPLLQSYTEMTL